MSTRIVRLRGGLKDGSFEEMDLSFDELDDARLTIWQWKRAAKMTRSRRARARRAGYRMAPSTVSCARARDRIRERLPEVVPEATGWAISWLCRLREARSHVE